MEIDKKSVGKRIQLIRQTKGMTLEKFGKVFGATRGNVSLWESGSSLPNNKRIKKIASIADIPVEDLLYGDPVPLDDELITKFEKDIKEKKDFIRQEVKLLWPAVKSGTTLGLAFKEEQDQAIKNRIEHDDRIKELEKFGFRYIVKNFDNYTYEKYLEEHPNSNLQEFTEFKEEQWYVFKEKIERLWKSFESIEDNYEWINKRFTDQITDELNKISQIAIEEDKEHYYINELVQPFLDKAAEEFKQYIKDNIDIEE